MASQNRRRGVLFVLMSRFPDFVLLNGETVTTGKLPDFGGQPTVTVLCLMIPACCFTGLSHEQNMAKMRLLTFMGMAVEFKEISFDTMEQELQIGADDVEAFVIDGTSTSLQ